MGVGKIGLVLFINGVLIISLIVDSVRKQTRITALETGVVDGRGIDTIIDTSYTKQVYYYFGFTEYFRIDEGFDRNKIYRKIRTKLTHDDAKYLMASKITFKEE